MEQDIQRLFCQHCKALQKTNKTVVECWYNPLDDEKRHAFCAANEDAVKDILAKAKQHYHPSIEAQKLQVELAKKQERERIQALYENMGCVPEEDNCWYRFWQALKGKNNDNKDLS